LRKEADYDDFMADVEEQAVVAASVARSTIERIRMLS
jgi:hypothetical protein